MAFRYFVFGEKLLEVGLVPFLRATLFPDLIAVFPGVPGESEDGGLEEFLEFMRLTDIHLGFTLGKVVGN